MTVTETAEYLRISRSLVNRLSDAGTLKIHRLGGRILFDVLEVDEAVRISCSTPVADQHAA
jgi:excisionase family DNA binding protein